MIMMNLLKPGESQIVTWFIIGVFSAWGGVVRHLLSAGGMKIHRRRTSIFSQVIVSAFSGILGGLLVFEAGGSNYMSFIISGLLGSLGGNALDYLYRYFLPDKTKRRWYADRAGRKWSWQHWHEWTDTTIVAAGGDSVIYHLPKQKKRITLPSGKRGWQPGFTDLTLSHKTDTIQSTRKCTLDNLWSLAKVAQEILRIPWLLTFKKVNDSYADTEGEHRWRSVHVTWACLRVCVNALSQKWL